jgi:hypothetical protein
VIFHINHQFSIGPIEVCFDDKITVRASVFRLLAISIAPEEESVTDQNLICV